MSSPFATPAMHALKRRIVRAQADALEALGPQPTRRPRLGEQPAVVRVTPAVGKPFATEAMRALRRRARRRPDLGTLYAWSGNERVTLEELVNAVPPEGGVEGLIEDMENEA